MLSLAGEWIVGAGPQLEAAGASLLSLAKDAKRVILDLAGLQRMDTAGAWFIDRAQDELAGAGATVSYRGEQPKHDLLLKEAGYHPPEKSTLVHPAHTVALLSAVGETIYDSGVDFFDIVDYLGEVVVMFLRLAPHPWRWRWTPMVYHLEMYGLRSVPDHHTDQLSGRRDRHSAGHLSARQIRRRGLRRQPGWRLGFARTRRAYDFDHDRGTDRIVDHRRDRLDEDARRDRRSEGDGA